MVAVSARPSSGPEPPLRSRYGVDWSVKVTPERLDTDRWVLYGLDDEAVVRFLHARRVAYGLTVVRELMAQHPPAFQLMVGAAEDRTKLYVDLEGDDPGLFCLDLWPDRHRVRFYRRMSAGTPGALEAAVAQCHPALHDDLRWLHRRCAQERDGLFHFVLQRVGTQGLYTGADLGFERDWEQLAQRSSTLFRHDLLRDVLRRKGLEHQTERVIASLLNEPLGMLSYVGFRHRDGAPTEVNVYAVRNPVVQTPEGLAHLQLTGDGFVPRLLSLSYRLDALPHIEFRLHPPAGDPRCYVRVGAWAFEHGRHGGRRVADAAIELGLAVARAAIAGCSATAPKDLVALVRAIRACEGVTQAGLAPAGGRDRSGGEEAAG